MPETIYNILRTIDLAVTRGEVQNNELIQIIEHAGAYLNLKTIPDYAKFEGISYNGAKNNRHVQEIFGVKFVIDNH